MKDTIRNHPLTLAVHWQRFGPYHIARLRAAARGLQDLGGIRVIGFETASCDSTYLWQEEPQPDGFESFTAFPARNVDEVSPREMWKGVRSLANRTNPDVIAISGFSTHDAYALLSWCKFRRRAAILMSETKWDDKPRSASKEFLKRLIVRQYAAALCGGTPHREYLQRLGLARERIFTGYDAVDNDYFWRNAVRVRANPQLVRHLPGLSDPTPFFLASARFIKRKNLDGLLRAYSLYRRQRRLEHSQGLPWRLVILGDGEERPNLETLAIEEQIADVVCFAGFAQIAALPGYYGLAGAFIHPAFQDQWGLVVNEAMASGLPVLVSNRAGCATDLVVEGKTGYTFDPENTPELAALMAKISSDSAERCRMGKAALEHVNEWGLNKFVTGLWGALQMALSPRIDARS